MDSIVAPPYICACLPLCLVIHQVWSALYVVTCILICTLCSLTLPIIQHLAVLFTINQGPKMTKIRLDRAMRGQSYEEPMTD